jgi:hypothetical protein
MTTGMQFKAMVDSDTSRVQTLLQAFENLPLRDHNVTFSTNPTSQDSSFTIDRAVVTMGTGLTECV